MTSELYPLLMMPDFRERVWGTRDLAPVYARIVGDEPIGEVWLTGDECKVANGPLAGSTLADLCARFGSELIGEAAPDPNRFPLLVKFIFPKQKLSVQVHPDDEAARRAGLPCGKTECWYVYRAVAGAQVGLGLKPGTTHEEFEQSIHETRAEELLNWVDVKTGELIYVDAGTVHAIAPGSILVETMQNSDTTYRLYDYGRPRELHVRDGLAVMREKTNAGKVSAQDVDGHELLVSSPCFVVEKFEAEEPLTFISEAEKRSAQVLVALNGCGVVECEGSQPVSFNRGEAVVIPASQKMVSLRPQWKIEFLRMSLPSKEVPVPATMLVQP
jgi:mannose-6-phosphate isomerase